MATLQRLCNPASLQRTGQSGQCQPSVANGVAGTVEFNVRKERANLTGVEVSEPRDACEASDSYGPAPE